MAFDDIRLEVFGLDCNGNDVADFEDIANGTSNDANGDGFPDECAGILGDLNCDGIVNGEDVVAFVLAAVNPAAYSAQFPNCDLQAGDCNSDLATTVDDIACFAAIVLGN